MPQVTTPVSRKRYEREQRARAQAEQLLEQKSIELFEANQRLKGQAEALEETVRLRTLALSKAHDEAQAASRAKSEFLATMSHELRTPLHGLLGMLVLMTKSDLNETQAKYAAMARESSERLQRIVDDILDYSQLGTGRLTLSPSEFDLQELIVEVATTLASSGNSTGVELTCSISPGAPTLVRCDALRIRQVMKNLIGNALKFTSEGHIEVTLAAADEPHQAYISVRDTGAGIDSAQQVTLFDAFTQADGSDTRHHGGTGMGLAVSRALVDLMGGEIGVQSELGKGSCFWFTVAYEPVEKPATPDATP